MNDKARLIIFITISGLFLLADRWLKAMSLDAWAGKHLLNNYLGWYPSQNAGIAFGLPLPVWLTIAFTIPIIIFLVYLFIKNGGLLYTNVALPLIIAGAFSNLIDRIVYGGALDYILVLTSIFNLADVMIVAGFAFIILFGKKPNKQLCSSSSNPLRPTV